VRGQEVEIFDRPLEEGRVWVGTVENHGKKMAKKHGKITAA